MTVHKYWTKEGGPFAEKYSKIPFRKLHKEDGPAFIRYYSNDLIMEEHYCQNGYLHRDNGPAYTCYVSSGLTSTRGYYFYGKNKTDEVKKWLRDNNFPSDYKIWSDEITMMFRLKFL